MEPQSGPYVPGTTQSSQPQAEQGSPGIRGAGTEETLQDTPQ